MGNEGEPFPDLKFAFTLLNELMRSISVWFCCSTPHIRHVSAQCVTIKAGRRADALHHARMAALAKAEGTGQMDCVDAVQAALCESGWPEWAGPAPATPAEWKQTRRWGKAYIKRQTAWTQEARRRYHQMDGWNLTTLRELVRWVENRGEEGWPIDGIPRPANQDEQRKLVTVLAQYPEAWQ